MRYAELQVTSHFSFLRGASSCEELFAHAAMLGLITLAVVASFHVVGTLLVFGLLIAPPAAAAIWARSIPAIMAGAALLGSASTFVGLLVSWHWGTAAGASISATAVAFFFVSVAASRVRHLGAALRPRTAVAPPAPNPVNERSNAS